MKIDNGEQQLSKWTQQLHDKLAEHETAAPADLWADIEAALAQQSGSPATQPDLARQPKPKRSRFVALQRWAVAASVAVLLLGGGYLWWAAQLPSHQGENPAIQLPYHQGENPTAQFPSLHGEGQGVGSVTNSDLAQIIPSEEIIQTPPLTPPLEWRGKTAQTAEQPQSQTAEQTQSQTTEQTQSQTAEQSQHQLAEQPLLTETPADLPPTQELRGSPAGHQKRQPTIALYAMNGLDNHNSANGVQMAGTMAQQYLDTYTNSQPASARSSEPIYLTGYEEQQHHHRPVTFGLTLSYPLSARLSLTTGVVYTKLQSDFAQIMRSQQIQQEQTLHYVGIPLSLSYKLWTYRTFCTYLSTGIRADWNVKTHLETEGASQHLPKDRMQWSLNGSLGLQYDIIPKLGLYLEPCLNWYPDNGSAIQNYFKDKPLNFGLQLGLRLNFN
jgi:hypothetical protein